MANPRQRRKSKSSSYKPVNHARRAKKMQKKMPAIRGPKILQDSWDKSKTVRQNYAALGLQSSLNPLQSGGVEKELVRGQSKVPEIEEARPAPSSDDKLRRGFGRIVRDEDGNVLRIELPEEDDGDTGAKMDEDDGALPEAQIDDEVADKWVSHSASGLGTGSTTSVVDALESLAKSGSRTMRHTSSGEKTYLDRLVDEYGVDVEKMARDRRLNPEQKTVGELRRALKKAGLELR